jgi:hypothetical protein
MNALANIFLVLLFVGGVLAVAGLIAAKSPGAGRLIGKLVPYQALIGVALLAIAPVMLLHLGPIHLIKELQHNALFAAAWLGAIASAVALGFFFGTPQLLKWAPGPSAEARAMELSQKLAPYTVLVGLLMLGSAVVLLLAKLGLLKYI